MKPSNDLLANLFDIEVSEQELELDPIIELLKDKFSVEGIMEMLEIQEMEIKINAKINKR